MRRGAATQPDGRSGIRVQTDFGAGTLQAPDRNGVHAARQRDALAARAHQETRPRLAPQQLTEAHDPLCVPEGRASIATFTACSRPGAYWISSRMTGGGKRESRSAGSAVACFRTSGSSSEQYRWVSPNSCWTSLVLRDRRGPVKTTAGNWRAAFDSTSDSVRA